MPLPARFSQADIARALRALEKREGSWRLRILPDGEIVIERAFRAAPMAYARLPPFAALKTGLQRPNSMPCLAGQTEAGRAPPISGRRTVVGLRVKHRPN